MRDRSSRRNPRDSARQGTGDWVEVSFVSIIIYSQILYLTIYHLVAIIHIAAARGASFLDNGSNSTTATTPEDRFSCITNIILILLPSIHILILSLFHSTMEGECGEDGNEGGMDCGKRGDDEE